MGRYRILESIGQGGMGRVYLAEDPALNRRVAIKVLPPEFAHDRERRERLVHEARAASALNHPNIIIVHDLGESDGTLFIATELVDGETLRAWAGARPRTPSEILRLMRQATAALQVAHAAGLVHRDLKPENLMVRRDGLLKILDFGLVRSLTPEESGRTATMPGTVLGTPPYMSPEQVLGQAAGPSSDLFSLGTILYELLTGKHPFGGDSIVDTMHRILHETPDPPSRVNHALTSDFDFVLAKALSKDPTRRHASAADFDVDLETLECGCGTSAATGKLDAAGPRAIAVLPFKNIGGDPELNYLGVGLADAVITRLSFSPDLIVRATSSIAPYANQPIDPRRVGQELDVTAVLDASFQRAGERFRATARLVETPAGRSLWAGKLDLRFDDIFEVQDQVAQGIADALTARLSQEGAAAIRQQFTPSPEAFQYLMRAREEARWGTRDGLLKAVELLERAVIIEPDYAEAWAQLGNFYHVMNDGGFTSDPAWYEKAERALSRARKLDPEDGIAIFATATLNLVRGRKREAYAGLVDASRRMPNLPHIYHYFSYLFRLCDMLDEGLQASARAFEMDPNNPWPIWMTIRLLTIRGDVESARARLDVARPKFGHHPRFQVVEAIVLRCEGRYLESIAVLDRNSAAGESPAQGEFERALCHVRVGDREKAAASMDFLEKSAVIDMDQAAGAASLWSHLGDADKAFRHLDRAAALGNDSLRVYESDAFEPLRSDPRWRPFIDGVRARVAQWRREFRWPLP